MVRSSNRRKAAQQHTFEFKRRGGARVGSGRKPKGERAGVAHGPREALAARFPVHVTMRLCAGLPSLRKKPEMSVLKGIFAAACARFETRLVHYAVQSNHLHLIVESADSRALSRAMQGLAVRMAKGLNRLWERSGRAFADRYHARILRTPREVRNAIVYVLRNHARHGIGIRGLDPFASGRWFAGWREAPGRAELASHLAQAKTWLLKVGWRAWGLVSMTEVPRGSRRNASAGRSRRTA